MNTQTTPLAKAITTLEGQLVLATNVVLGAAAATNPQSLPPKYAAIVAGATNIALLVQRMVIKVKASPTITSVLNSPDALKAIEADLLGTKAAKPSVATLDDDQVASPSDKDVATELGG